MKKLLLVTVMISMGLYANECFDATGKALSDAQTIRKVAKGMHWKVGKMASIAAGTFIKGKASLYPQGSIEVCLRENGANQLEFRAQSSSSDAEAAVWKYLPAKRK